MAKEKLIVMDMKDDIRRHLKKDARFDFARTMRDANLNVYRCINAALDKNATKAFNMKMDEETNKTILDIWFPSYDPERPVTKMIAQKELNDAVSLLKKKNYKVIKSVLFEDPDTPEEKRLLGKILIDLKIPEMTNLKDRSAVVTMSAK